MVCVLAEISNREKVMKRNKLPDDHLDIVTPVLDAKVNLTKPAHGYPELAQGMYSKQVGRLEIEMYPITGKSPLAARRAVEILGSYFRREFGYDFPPYEAEAPLHTKDRLFLFTDDDWYEKHALGAIGFSWREYSNAPVQLVLSWVWLHPFLRSKGILSAFWELFHQW